MKYNPAEQLGMMWNFLKMGNQKANVPLLKEYVYDLIQLMTQKTAGQRGNKNDISFDDIETIWKCKTLQNWKYLLSSTLFDGMYYELTYNGDKNEWYLDAYKKFQNVVVK